MAQLSPGGWVEVALFAYIAAFKFLSAYLVSREGPFGRALQRVFVGIGCSFSYAVFLRLYPKWDFHLLFSIALRVALALVITSATYEMIRANGGLRRTWRSRIG